MPEGQTPSGAESQAAVEGEQALGNDAKPAETAAAQPLQLPQFLPKPGLPPTSLPGEEDNMLFGPTDRPSEPLTVGNIQNGQAPPPAEAYQGIQELARIAAAPDAPAALKGLSTLLTHLLSRQ